MSNQKKENRKGGLGRGIAALIPTAPAANPSVGESAADIIFGPRRTQGTKQSRSSGVADVLGAAATGSGTSAPERKNAGKSTKSGQNKPHTNEANKRHSDDNAIGKSSNVSRETIPSTTSGVADHSGAEAADVDATAANEFGATYREVDLKLITPNPKQPREVFDEEPLNELAHSIREFGLLQPIIVRPISTDNRAAALEAARKEDPNALQPEFEIIMGERRWRASQRAGIDTIPAIVRDTPNQDMLRDALLENIHRVQLNPLEEAAAYQQLLDEFGVTQAELADRIGRSRPVITNMIRLLQLPVEVQRRVAVGVLSAGHARALLGVKAGKEEQQRLAERIVAEGLSVRATEEAVTLLNAGERPKKQHREPTPQPEVLHNWADRLSNSFDTKVTAQMGKRKGKIVIEFGNLEDFDRIMSLMHLDEE